MKNHKNYKSFVYSFCSNDAIRKDLSKPTCYESGLVVSTDAIRLLLFYDKSFYEQNKDDCYLFSNEPKVGVNSIPILKNFLSLYVENTNAQPLGYVELSDFDEKFKEIQMIPEYKVKYKDCENCEGYGNTECECCGQDVECEECRGQGSIKISSNEIGYYNFPSGFFMINGIAFSIERAYELCEGLKSIDASVLEVFYLGKNRGFFRIKDTDHWILFMGSYYDSDSDYLKYKIEIKK